MNLSDLLDKRDALRRKELVKAIMKSDRTYEEVLAFLEPVGGNEHDEEHGERSGLSNLQN